MFLKLILLASMVFAIRDWFIIEVKKKVPNHGKGFTMRLVICSGICLVVAKDNLDIVENFIAAPCIVWFVFQYGLNFLRGKPFDYLSPESSKIDGFLLKTLGSQTKSFVVLLCLFIASVIFKIYGL